MDGNKMNSEIKESQILFKGLCTYLNAIDNGIIFRFDRLPENENETLVKPVLPAYRTSVDILGRTEAELYFALYFCRAEGGLGSMDTELPFCLLSEIFAAEQKKGFPNLDLGNQIPLMLDFVSVCNDNILSQPGKTVFAVTYKLKYKSKIQQGGL